MRTLKRPESPPDPYKAQPLPITRPIAVYYRQSSEAQVGNISTTLQTVDMVEHLEKRGWLRERIRMVDLDRGISGTKGIKERPGMSTIFDLIERGEIGAVASQDVDRFFREMAQIETNIFIETCRQHNVLVLTPTFVYDFAHPNQGRFHIQMFREQVQRAADYLEFHIRGRLVKARDYRTERGFYTGRKIAAGFMVDRRETLPDGAHNPNFCKYVRFDPWADVTLAIFTLFRENEGNLDETWRQLDAEGSGYPDVTEPMIPAGFQWRSHLKRHSPTTGQLVPSAFGLKYMLTNVAYIGHWVHKQVVVGWNNHEAIIPLDLFMYAYNRLSRTDFLGDPNPYYVPYRPWVRHDKAERQVEPPTYSYLAYTDDLPHHLHKQVATIWDTTKSEYKYLLADLPRQSNVWAVMARLVDGSVDRMLLERLKATTLDENAWQTALTSFGQDDRSETRRVQTAIRAAEQAKDNLVASLATLTNPEMVQRAQSRYETANSEIAMLTAELEAVKAKSQHSLVAMQARPALEKVVANWERVPRTEKRALFEGFATHIQMTKLSRICKRITIHWRDGSQSSATTTQETRSHFWEKEDIDKLGQMFEDNVDQVEILRAFPDFRWETLQERYCYYFCKDHSRAVHYTGKRTYSEKTRWADTREAKLGELPQPVASSSSSAQSARSTDRRRPRQ